MNTIKELVTLLEGDKRSKAAATHKKHLKSAPNEEEHNDLRCEESFPSKFEPSLSKDSAPYEEFASIVRQDFDVSPISLTPNYYSNRESAHALGSSPHRTSPPDFKSPLQSASLADTLQLLSCHKDSIKSQGKEVKKGNYHSKSNGTNPLSIGKQPTQANSQRPKHKDTSAEDKKSPKASKQKRMDDFLHSSTSSVKGLIGEEDIECTFRPRILADSNALPHAQQCVGYSSYARPNRLRTCKSGAVQGDEKTFKSQAESAVGKSSFCRKTGCETSKKSSETRKGSNWCKTPQGKGNSYREGLDKNLRKEQIEVLRSLGESQFSHQPEILPVSKQRKPSTPYEMSYEPVRRKQEKIKAIRKEMLDKANKEYTFAPGLEVDAYTNVDSKLKLKGGMNTYLERVKKDNEEKTRRQKLYKEMKEIEEMLECTHTPKINKHKNKCTRASDWN
eukprot:TRINITY_DN6425_c0_g1_i13.p1 TRINITY_DN6425_c0_g1~~TRINITY_DN6425_c0_g1_i13.p1  ORF type:complete len:447 (-),score=137.45 TRINITY_DN6425_c0_g1_i13:158-1498(-)